MKTPEEIVSEIESLCWEIEKDYRDPSYQVKQIKKSCNELRSALANDVHVMEVELSNYIKEDNEKLQDKVQRLSKEKEELREVLKYAQNYLKKGGFGRVDCFNKVTEALNPKE